MCRISLNEINSDYQVIDLRDPYSYHHSHLRNSINISQININMLDKPTILICYSGKQAKELAMYYNSIGKDCYYLEGGYQSIVNQYKDAYY
ncbi:MAG: rhodanese-like domain-containing protein [Erysipelotrichaceae bacterium]|nr:rhodanese-like domain-containing protein [Erysipelotrichaceae bacterium]